MDKADINRMGNDLKDGAQDLAKDAQRALAKGADKLADGIDSGVSTAKRLMDRADRAVDDLKDGVQSDVEPTARQVRDWLLRGGDAARRAVSRAQDHGKRYMGDCQDYIENNPGKAVMIAAGAGALVAAILLWGNRRSRY